MKTRKYRNDIFKPEHMQYDEENDYYICPNGKRLNYIYTSKYTTENNYETNRKVYRCEDCSGCPYRENCYHSEKNRTIRRTDNNGARHFVKTKPFNSSRRCFRRYQTGLSFQTFFNKGQRENRNSIFTACFCI